MENSRIPGEHFFTTSDNTALFYRHWPALQPGAKKVIVLFHRGHEHSGRLQHLVDELAMPDTAFYAWDARGHGKSSGPRGYSPSLARSVRDVDEFVRFAASDSQVGLEEVVVIAQSVGAVLVATWIHDYAPAIRGLVLASPAFKVKLYVPLARPALALWHRLRGLFFINSYVKGRYLTHVRQTTARRLLADIALPHRDVAVYALVLSSPGAGEQNDCWCLFRGVSTTYSGTECGSGRHL